MLRLMFASCLRLREGRGDCLAWGDPWRFMKLWSMRVMVVLSAHIVRTIVGSHCIHVLTSGIFDSLLWSYIDQPSAIQSASSTNVTLSYRVLTYRVHRFV
jgi:hypothetical protein